MKWKRYWFAFECGYVDPYDCMILMILMILMIFLNEAIDAATLFTPNRR